jgi:hypothetical protein
MPRRARPAFPIPLPSLLGACSNPRQRPTGEALDCVAGFFGPGLAWDDTLSQPPAP